MNENALVRKWSPLATVIAREFFHPTLDADDLRQEALIALMVAGRTYDPSHGTRFGPFAAMCIRRRLITTLKLANAMKRDWRMEAPREVVTEEGDALLTVDLLPALNADPHDRTVLSLELRRIVHGIGSLTDLERRAIIERIDGIPQDKSMDNASNRARQKLRLAA